ncbi:hypothetical protein [Treponema bryantii]|uniref:hypothetical protein n=1 Tax=Treponema bryantii TaxID=163 RepID=UPI0003B6E843|nr:hypothetical protein [Treponema bryantii]
MRIISYNISSCSQHKLDELFKREAEVYVIPEMARDVKIPDGYFMKWAGKYSSKGLGIIFNNAYVPDCYDESLPYAIPLRYEDLFILAFWPTKIDKTESYTQIAKQILNHYAPELKVRDSIVTGDFNLYHKIDKPNKDADILEIDELLKSFRLKSVYHEKSGKAFGEEVEKTYFHQYKADNLFFLDYTYYSYEKLKITKYELLDWDTKFSDHRGQIIEF